MEPAEPDPVQWSEGQWAVANDAVMIHAAVAFAYLLRAAVRSPELSDYQRTQASGIAWGHMAPYLGGVGADNIKILIGQCQAALAAGVLGARIEDQDDEGIEEAAARLEEALDHIERMNVESAFDYASHLAEFIERVRDEVPIDPPDETEEAQPPTP